MNYVDGEVLKICPYCGNEYGGRIECCGEHYGHAAFVIYGDESDTQYETEAEAEKAADILFPIEASK